jgi:hypothetical protein
MINERDLRILSEKANTLGGFGHGEARAAIHRGLVHLSNDNDGKYLLAMLAELSGIYMMNNTKIGNALELAYNQGKQDVWRQILGFSEQPLDHEREQTK